MGKILPMAALKVRLGHVRKLEKAAKRAAEARCRAPARVGPPGDKLAAGATDRGAMSSSSLFTKVRNAALAHGQTKRTAVRNARRLDRASFSDLVRLTPEQNVKLGLSRKARHYVLKDAARVTTATPTITARQYRVEEGAGAFWTVARTGDSGTT